jgi:hypothetical protein
MKKYLGLVSFFLVFSLLIMAPTRASATAADVYYDLGGGSKLYIGALVCKIADCINAGESTDWKDYSTTSENVAGDAGSGDTLVVAPGDVLTFLGATSIEGDAVLDPIYGIEFTNGSYLTIDNLFGDIINDVDYADVDADDNSFFLASEDDIDLTGGLDNSTAGQIGAITATVNADTPDGTLITGIFYVVDPDRAWITLGPSKVMAADGDLYLRAEVRMLVSNPAPVEAVAATPTATLPATGAGAHSQLPYLLLFVSLIIAFGEFYVLKRVKK